MIKRIQIRNFKSLRDVDVEMGRTNVLVGPNMSGKSNFIDAFKFLIDLLIPGPGVHGVPNAVMKRNGFQEVAWKGGGGSNVIAFTLDGTLAGKEGHPLKWTYNLEILGSVP